MVSLQKRPINSICYREYHSAGNVAIPSLLVNPTDSTVTLYRYLTVILLIISFVNILPNLLESLEQVLFGV